VKTPSPDWLAAIAAAVRALLAAAKAPTDVGYIELCPALAGLEMVLNPQRLPFDDDDRSLVSVTGWPDSVTLGLGNRLRCLADLRDALIRRWDLEEIRTGAPICRGGPRRPLVPATIEPKERDQLEWVLDGIEQALAEVKSRDQEGAQQDPIEQAIEFFKDWYRAANLIRELAKAEDRKLTWEEIAVRVDERRPAAARFHRNAVRKFVGDVRRRLESVENPPVSLVTLGRTGAVELIINPK